ncbi:DNA cytosine methyltransferase [Escherichia sp. E2593]|uniref:DNA cytosine methyltransferase n=1 Tax=unclassified Escherichia TaxID=2608889 RepID=UPI001029FBEE|nr:MULTISPECIES: DNA cytosine methyltransferase [unclassified Escherichia]RZN40417.1 DNA cytosine methyltransferase [Escherichia sp. E10V5]TGC06846.1 DNA cytosine methyltransferase [Escherichia sp. E2593]TLI81923.1 DNA cytosine methyltransferase [Escherichia sp. E2593]
MIPAAYYNEIDPFAAQWLRNLIAGGHIAPGEVDERSIEDVTPDDLREFTQHHFFAGIGVWSHSLRLAGWPDDKPVWTGSPPCQPFSAAGKGDGFDDERHLWPAFFHLISECGPQHVFGEQVAAGNANPWFDLVQADLEGLGYAFGLVPFAAAGVGAPHIRERAYWVAHASGEHKPAAGNEARPATCLRSGAVNGMANTNGERFNRFDSLLQREKSGRVTESLPETTGHSTTSRMGNANDSRLEGHIWHDSAAGWKGATGSVAETGIHSGPLEVNGFWRDADWLFCRDGQWRPVESGTFPLVARFAKSLGHGKSSLRALAGRNRTGRLKGYGNAINAQAEAEFIRAYMGVNYGK